MNRTSYDLIVYGATGFVGRLISSYLLEYAANKDEIKWAIAGRSEKKLLELKDDLGQGARDLPMIVADAADESELYKMCEQTRVVVSTVGPYALYGEPLISACAASGTDYCDLTGEIQWIYRMIDKYASAAEESGARIVNCCGFDSVPSDMGVFFLQQNAVERHGRYCSKVKMRVKNLKGTFSGGTIASMITSLKEAKANKEMRHVFTDPYSLCPPATSSRPIQKSVLTAQYDENFESWVAPFAMAIINEHVVRRSSIICDPNYGDLFFYNEGMLTGPGRKGRRRARGMSLGMGFFLTCMMISPLRWMLERFVLPAPGKGPTPEEQEQGFYDIRFWGETPDGGTVKVKVAGDRDPGYGSTAKMLGQAGICLAKDISKEDKTGGFWTPASIFGDRLIQRLRDHAGIVFDALE